MGKVSVKVPATSANLGPGFDTLGLALTLYNTLTFEECGSDICVTGCDAKYGGRDNLAVQAYFLTLRKSGVCEPDGLCVDIKSDVPISRGLGSSSTLTVAGIMAADKIHNLGLDRRDMLLIAAEIEGHPDNAAPAIYGGLCASIVRGGAPITVKYNVAPGLYFTAIVPNFETSTAEARRVLPDEIPRADAVHTVSSLAVLLKALETGDIPALRAAFSDKLHEPYRKKMIPGFDEAKKIAMDADACAFIISGSGSTCLAVSNIFISGRLKPRFDERFPDWKILPLTVDSFGALVSEVK